MTFLKTLICVAVAGLATKIISSTKDEREQINDNIDNFFEWVSDGIDSAAEKVKTAYENL
jgi:hypothetical protein